MKSVRAACIRSTHWAAFQPGQTARILGVVLVVPREGDEERACFHVEYPNGRQDWVPIFNEPADAYSIVPPDGPDGTGL